MINITKQFLDLVMLKRKYNSQKEFWGYISGMNGLNYFCFSISNILYIFYIQDVFDIFYFYKKIHTGNIHKYKP